jgi:hypothetical protein
MSFVGLGQAALHAAKSLKTTTTGQPLLDAIKTVMRGGASEHGGRWGDLINLHNQFSARGNTEGLRAMRDGFENAVRGWGKER